MRGVPYGHFEHYTKLTQSLCLKLMMKESWSTQRGVYLKVTGGLPLYSVHDTIRG